MIPTDGLIDIEAEKNRLSKELENITNEIEIIDFEHVLPEDEGIMDNQENYDQISFGLFSDNLEKEVINNNDFEENNVEKQTSEFDEINSYALLLIDQERNLVESGLNL